MTTTQQRGVDRIAFGAREIASACAHLARATTALSESEDSDTVEFLANTVSALATYLETLRNEMIRRTDTRHVLAGMPVVVGMTGADAKRWAERYAEQTAHVHSLSTMFGAVHAAMTHKAHALATREKHTQQNMEQTHGD